MLLLDQETITVDSARTIVVVSSREEIQSEVAQILRTRGLENVELVKKDFFAFQFVAGGLAGHGVLFVVVAVGFERGLLEINVFLVGQLPRERGGEVLIQAA